jgi:chromosome segregation ATPase
VVAAILAVALGIVLVLGLTRIGDYKARLGRTERQRAAALAESGRLASELEELREVEEDLAQQVEELEANLAESQGSLEEAGVAVGECRRALDLTGETQGLILDAFDVSLRRAEALEEALVDQNRGDLFGARLAIERAQELKQEAAGLVADAVGLESQTRLAQERCLG